MHLHNHVKFLQGGGGGRLTAKPRYLMMLHRGKNSHTVTENLQYLRDDKRFNHRQARWVLFFTRFNFTISYRPGPKNVRADALSHFYSPEEVCEEPVTIIPKERIVSPIQWNPESDTSSSLLRRAAHLVCNTSPEHDAPHLFTLCTHLWTLATPEPTALSHC